MSYTIEPEETEEEGETVSDGEWAAQNAALTTASTLAAETIVAGIEIDGETVTATVTVTTYEPDQDEEIVIMPEEEDDTMTEEDSTTMMTEEDSTMTEDDDMTTDEDEDDEPLSGNNMKFSTIVISLLCLAIGLFGQ